MVFSGLPFVEFIRYVSFDCSFRKLCLGFKNQDALTPEKVSKSFADDAEHDSWFAANLSSVYEQHQRWVKNLPHVRPFYAVKCNPDPYVLRLLASLGTGFDCASLGEIHLALAAMGPDASAMNELSRVQRIIFASPCKFKSHINGARKLDVRTSTFDNIDELEKIARLYPTMQLVIRILADDSHSRWPLGRKFGAHMNFVPALLQKAKKLDLNVIGVSFHVGSSCNDSAVFADSIWRARQVFDIAKEVGYTFTLLDIGGGFEDKLNLQTGQCLFEENARVITRAIEEHFPAENQPKGFEIIGEPGRFYVTKAFSLVTNVIARRGPIEGVAKFTLPLIPVPGKEGLDVAELMYYINDGTYGGLSNVLLDHKNAIPYIISMGQSFIIPDGEKEPASIWGPTLDSVDCVNPWVSVPSALRVGDWLGFSEMGAYTLSATTNFNGFDGGRRVLYTTGAGARGEEVWRILSEDKRHGGKHCAKV
ncbi:ornithine decarboxylase [Crassisporium funariophilum]|nr:ornithine decarboxylase [Crassisporium funariophilum]